MGRLKMRQLLPPFLEQWLIIISIGACQLSIAQLLSLEMAVYWPLFQAWQHGSQLWTSDVSFAHLND